MVIARPSFFFQSPGKRSPREYEIDCEMSGRDKGPKDLGRYEEHSSDQTELRRCCLRHPPQRLKALSG